MTNPSAETRPTYASDYHAPVMVAEVLDLLAPARGGTFLDGTLGGGGHAEALLESGPDATLIGVDQDAEALAVAAERLAPFGERVRLVRANFADAADAAQIGPASLVGVLLDLGISSHHIDDASRGFTFRAGAPLDMRMAADEDSVPTAAELLNEMEEADLVTLFRRYAEEPRARRLASEVVARRANRPLQTSDEMVSAIEAVIPRATAQDKARIFQGLRIAVNREMDVLEAALPAFREALAPGGVFAVLAYHSLEDRLVKNAFREWSRQCICPPELPICRCRGEPLGELLTRKPRSASAAEVQANPRSRSARLRGWRKA